MKTESYGSIWQKAASEIGDILNSSLARREQMQKILGLGYFSQFTSYPSPTFNEAVVVWLEQYLSTRHRLNLGDLPASLSELDTAPSSTIVPKAGRKVSPDLLRYVAYAMLLRAVKGNDDLAEKDVLEIGGGYGGLARTLKCFHPQARFWLTDIPEALRCAEFYLRKAFPDARITWLNAETATQKETSDFYLIPAADAFRLLFGRPFALAINIWSFGEMPNSYVKVWLKLLQRDCIVEWLFTINSFMAPVTPVSVGRAQLGDWLFGLDDRWAIEHWEIDLGVHRCPLMRNFPKGIAVVAKRISDESGLSRMRKAASLEAEKVLQEDWTWIAVTDQALAEPGRPERFVGQWGLQSDWRTISAQRLNALTEYIGHFNMEAGMDGPFFRLWNDYRMNQSERSGALLVAYMGMVGKSDVTGRCTKEELSLLRRLPELPLHKEYGAFAPAFKKGKVAHDGDWLTDQEACDLALDYKKSGEFEAAEVLWTKVAAAYPAHGDCWYQLALLLELRGVLHFAAVFAAHSVSLGCPYYAESAERMKALFLTSDKKKRPGLRTSLFSRQRSAHSAGVESDGVDIREMELCRQYFEGGQGRSLTSLAAFRRNRGEDVMAQALDMAAAFYS